jgi:predicted transcriptional regulator
MGIDDSEFNIPEYSKICTYCAHAIPQKRKCKAFDDLIPLEIWMGEHTHRTPYPGDHGIVFEWRDSVVPAVREEVTRELAGR